MTDTNCLFILGMPKSGTTYLYASLLRNEVIQAHKNGKKEPYYFLDHSLDDLSINDFKSSFVNEGEPYICDATPHYIFEESTIKKIRSVFEKKNIKLIICLRDRVSQIYSHYVHFCIHHLIKDIWEKVNFETPVTPSFFLEDCVSGNYKKPLHESLTYLKHNQRPILPAIKSAVDWVGMENIIIFNAHKDFSKSSQFFERLSKNLGVNCEPHPDHYWSQKFIPEIMFFQKDANKIIDGKEYHFQCGDLLVGANHYSQLYRGVSEQLGNEIIQLQNVMHTTLDQGTIDLIASSSIYCDFTNSLEFLGLDPLDYPISDPITLQRPFVDPTILGDVPFCEIEFPTKSKSTTSLKEPLDRLFLSEKRINSHKNQLTERIRELRNLPHI